MTCCMKTVMRVILYLNVEVRCRRNFEWSHLLRLIFIFFNTLQLIVFRSLLNSSCCLCVLVEKRGQHPTPTLFDNDDAHNSQACVHKQRGAYKNSSFQLCPLKSSNIMRHLQSNYVFSFSPLSSYTSCELRGGGQEKHEDQTSQRETNMERRRELDVCWQLVCPPLFGPLRKTYPKLQGNLNQDQRSSQKPASPPSLADPTRVRPPDSPRNSTGGTWYHFNLCR